MALSASFVTIVLTLLASQWPRTLQTYPDPLQVLDAVSSEDLSDHTGQGVEGSIFDIEGNPDGEPDVLLNDLWSDISSAFQFLEDRPMDDKLRARLLANEIELIRMREKAKRLPFNQHNFVRFGKRSSPNFDTTSPDGFRSRNARGVPVSKRKFHNFVRFGKRQASRGTIAELQNMDDTNQYDGQGGRSFIKQNQLNLGLKGNGMLKHHSIGHLGSGNLEQFQNRFFDSLYNRFRRSTSSQDEHEFPSLEKSSTPDNPVVDDDTHGQNLKYTDQSNTEKSINSDVMDALNSWRQYAKRRLANTRIGRLPASVFYPQWLKVNSDGPPRMSSNEEMLLTQNPSLDLNALPRYG